MSRASFDGYEPVYGCLYTRTCFLKYFWTCGFFKYFRTLEFWDTFKLTDFRILRYTLLKLINIFYFDAVFIHQTIFNNVERLIYTSITMLEYKLKTSPTLHKAEVRSNTFNLCAQC